MVRQKKCKEKYLIEEKYTWDVSACITKYVVHHHLALIAEFHQMPGLHGKYK